MADTAIWAAAFFVPLMTVVVWLSPAARRAIDRRWPAVGLTEAERDAGAQTALADVAERRHQLAIRQALIGPETEAERARLAAETARHETDRQAAARTLDAAVEGRKTVIAARAKAEADLAPEAARQALGADDLKVLGEAYAEFCRQYGYADTPTFGQWVGNFRGLG